CAVTFYQNELAQPPPHKPLGLRKVCKLVEAQFSKETKNKHGKLHLSHATLGWLVNSGKTIRQSNSERQWLLPEENEQLVAVLLELVEWGHPCNYDRLCKLVNEMLQARLGAAFPKSGIGKEWLYHFMERNSDRLHQYKARGLDDVCLQAVNETAHEAWCDLVEEVQLCGDDGNPITPECMFAMDEAGFQPNGGEGYEYIIGGVGKKLQYQEQKGSRKNIMVCVTICADGTALRPLVLYSGQGFQMKWQQYNPSKASYVN
ncbi:hypothetical protein FA15DRAFT_595383, partial [Coprinopsis marcescibilis]